MGMLIAGAVIALAGVLIGYMISNASQNGPEPRKRG